MITVADPPEGGVPKLAASLISKIWEVCIRELLH